jgi:hypothetical protein
MPWDEAAMEECADELKGELSIRKRIIDRVRDSEGELVMVVYDDDVWVADRVTLHMHLNYRNVLRRRSG